MKNILIGLLIFSALVSGISCFSEKKQIQQAPPPPAPEPAQNNTVQIPSSDIKIAEKIVISDLPEDAAIQSKISQAIDSGEFRNSRWGILAMSLKDGRAIAAIDAQKPFTPASIQKLLTSIVALDKLGGDFRWKTRVLAEKALTSGTLYGDLILHGEGSPDLDEAGLKKLADQLQSRGLNRVKGRIIGDESYFKGDKVGDGWTWNELQWYYGADASALTFNENQAKLSLSNGKPNLSDDFITGKGEVKPLLDIEAMGVKKEPGKNEVYVWGNANSIDARISVSDPALWSAKKFKAALENAGIAIEGEAIQSDWKDGTDRSKFMELAKIESRPLSEIITKMNKDSVNLYAELILRTLGKRFGSEAPDENPKLQRVRGDDSAGATYIEKWLKDNKLADDLIQVHDGSGLSRLGMVSPETICRALVWANQSKFADAFKNSLSVAGIDGTLKGRLQGSKTIGKTGSMAYVNSLAGYMNSAKGESIAFVVIVNNETGKADSTLMIDSIAGMLASR